MRSFPQNVSTVFDSTYEAVARVETSEELIKLLSQLKYEEERIVKLHHLADLTFEEVAKVVDKKVNTVKTIYYRAIGKLQKKGAALYGKDFKGKI